MCESFVSEDVRQYTASSIIMTLDKGYSDNPMQFMHLVNVSVQNLHKIVFFIQYFCLGYKFFIATPWLLGYILRL